MQSLVLNRNIHEEVCTRYRGGTVMKMYNEKELKVKIDDEYI
jgi:hypothetical protein